VKKLALVLLAGCGAAAAGDKPPQVVICPEGSKWDEAANGCIATQAMEPLVADPAPPPPSAAAAIHVRCNFQNGWVAVMPVDAYPAEEGFLMQALIGFTEEPAFWRGIAEYKDLERFAAQPCSSQGRDFDVEPGGYFVLVGEANTFGARGDYKDNGFKRRVTVDGPVSITVNPRDLTHTWLCISCPWVVPLDPDSGAWDRAFVVLAHRNRRELRGTDRVRVEGLRVNHGRLKLRIVEAEREVSHIDQLVVEVGGHTLLPARGGALSALARADGVDVTLGRGRQIELTFEVPGLEDGIVDAVVVAHGHYEPW
jgi:hypothetical protein